MWWTILPPLRLWWTLPYMQLWRAIEYVTFLLLDVMQSHCMGICEWKTLPGFLCSYKVLTCLKWIFGLGSCSHKKVWNHSTAWIRKYTKSSQSEHTSSNWYPTYLALKTFFGQHTFPYRASYSMVLVGLKTVLNYAFFRKPAGTRVCPLHCEGCTRLHYAKILCPTYFNTVCYHLCGGCSYVVLICFSGHSMTSGKA